MMGKAAIVIVLLIVATMISFVTNHFVDAYATATYGSPRESGEGAEACTKSDGNAEVCNPGSYGSPRHSAEGAEACTKSDGNAEVCNHGGWVSPRPDEHSNK